MNMIESARGEGRQSPPRNIVKIWWVGFSFLGVLGGRKGWTLKIRQRGPSLGNFE